MNNCYTCDPCTIDNILARLEALEKTVIDLQNQINNLGAAYKHLPPLFFHGSNLTTVDNDPNVYINGLYAGRNNYAVYYNGVKYLKPGIDFSYKTIEGGIKVLMPYGPDDEFVFLT